MTIQQKVEDFLKTNKTTLNKFFHGYPDGDINAILMLKSGLEQKIVDFCGGEDQGTEFWSVYKFTDSETDESCFVKFDGVYYSYDGATFERWYFVEAREVVVTQYHEDFRNSPQKTA
jgi:hypothetical protein